MTVDAISSFSPIGEPRWIGRVRRRLDLDLQPRLRAALVGGVAWLPLFAWALAHTALLESFAADAIVQARLLISTPVLIAVEPLIEARLRPASRMFSRGLVAHEELPRLDRLKAKIARLRDSPVVLTVLAVVALSLSALPAEDVPGWRSSGFAHFWYEFVGAPIFRFVLFRWLWRIGLWGALVIAVSRLELRLPATHPDGKCGIGFLSTCLTSFSWIAFAIGVPVAAAVHSGLGRGVEDAQAYVVPLALVAGVVVAIVFAPLLAFAGKLRVAKRLELLDFSELAARQSHEFNRRWFARPESSARLSAPDFSAVNDLQETYKRSSGESWFPIMRRPVLLVAAGAFAAAIPFLMIDRELLEVALKVLRAIG